MCSPLFMARNLERHFFLLLRESSYSSINKRFMLGRGRLKLCIAIRCDNWLFKIKLNFCTGISLNTTDVVNIFLGMLYYYNIIINDVMFV